MHGCIQDQLRKHRCELIAIGGIEDHVHVLTRFPTTVAVADVVKHCKGASSNLIAQTVAPRRVPQVAGHYGAFTLAKRHAPIVRDYILRQDEHPRVGRLNAELERVSDTGALAPGRMMSSRLRGNTSDTVRSRWGEWIRGNNFTKSASADSAA